jgi:hypothetical protein
MDNASAQTSTAKNGSPCQGILMMRLTSLYNLVKIICFSYWSYTFFKITYLNEEVNCTGPSPTVRVPCPN